MIQWFRKFFGSKNDRVLASYRKFLDSYIAKEAQKLNSLPQAELDVLWSDFRKNYTHFSFDEKRSKVFAFVQRFSEIVLQKRHYDVQLLGGLALSDGHIAEMATGEGKTLVATAPAIFQALEGQKVFVVTVNDYLAYRDAHLNKPLYEMMGLSVGIVTNQSSAAEKKEAYKANIIYVTNTRLGFDYLEDRTATSIDDLILPSLDFAIIDEVDSILIDEARKPLIISAPKAQDLSLYPKVAQLITSLHLANGDNKNGHFTIDIKTQQLDLTEEGHLYVEDLCRTMGLIEPEKSLYDEQYAELLHLVHISLKAKYLYHREKDYLVIDNQVVIVNEHTGRLAPGQRLSEGLHQAIEAKEGVPIQKESMTIASITYQNFFKKFKKISGMTGTADTEAQEFHEIYGLDVLVIPTNQPVRRVDKPDLIFIDQHAQEQALIAAIVDHHQAGRPVLVGTRSIDRSEHLSVMLTQKKIPHAVLNAKYHEQEAAIISQAGVKGRVTIATNMAGRGTDVILGGTYQNFLSQHPDASVEEWKAQQDEIRALGGLQVLGCERNDSRRIDLQLRGRSGRQGDPGSSQFYVHLDDQLLKVLPRSVVELIRYCHPNPLEPISDPMMDKRIAELQKAKEGMYFDARKHALEEDNVINDQRDVLYACRDEILKTSDLSATIRHYFFEAIQGMWLSIEPDAERLEQFKKIILDYYQVDYKDLALNYKFPAQISDFLEACAEQAFQSYQHNCRDIPAEQIAFFERDFLLRYLDTVWRDHLVVLETTKQQVSLRGYAQKDPRQEYKIEAFHLFERMMAQYARQVMHMFLRVRFVPKQPEPHTMAPQDPAVKEKKTYAVQSAAKDKPARNAPCPCGSGKKYKDCHGAIK